MPEAHEIRIKRAYLPPSDDDGQRILIDRLWPRGISRESLAATWLKDVAPSTALRKWYDHRPELWEEFKRRYRAELAANADVLAELQQYLARGRVTLVYGSRDETHNHAIALRDFLLGD